MKVQRPGIRKQVLEDLEVLREIAELLDRHTELGRRYGARRLVEEFRRSLMRRARLPPRGRNLTPSAGTSRTRPDRRAAAVDDYTTAAC